jgi:hypothetical protein
LQNYAKLIAARIKFNKLGKVKSRQAVLKKTVQLGDPYDWHLEKQAIYSKLCIFTSIEFHKLRLDLIVSYSINGILKNNIYLNVTNPFLLSTWKYTYNILYDKVYKEGVFSSNPYIEFLLWGCGLISSDDVYESSLFINKKERALAKVKDVLIPRFTPDFKFKQVSFSVGQEVFWNNLDSRTSDLYKALPKIPDPLYMNTAFIENQSYDEVQYERILNKFEQDEQMYLNI